MRERGFLVLLILDGAVGAIRTPNAAHRFSGLSDMAKVDDWAALMTGDAVLVSVLWQQQHIHLLPGCAEITYADEGTARLTPMQAAGGDPDNRLATYAPVATGRCTNASGPRHCQGGLMAG